MIPPAWGTPLLVAVLALLAVERLVELRINARNLRAMRGRGGRLHENDGFLPILLLHVGLFPALAAEWFLAPWSAVGAWTLPLLALALAAQVLRYWCITSLGDRWSVRVVTVPGEAPVTNGPYRWIRHPNYAAVALELAVIPLAFGCVATALVLGVANAAALRRRIRAEEAALEEAAPYRGFVAMRH